MSEQTQKLREALQALVAAYDMELQDLGERMRAQNLTSVTVNGQTAIGMFKAVEQARQALAMPTEPERPQNCGTSFCSCIECVMEPSQPVGELLSTSQDNNTSALANHYPEVGELPPLPSTSMWEERIKTLMRDCGHPNSRSLYQAFKQFQNEFSCEMVAYGTECWKAGYKHGAWAYRPVVNQQLTGEQPVGELPKLHAVTHIELGDDSHDVVTLEAAQAYGTECWKAGYKHGAWADKAVGELPDEREAFEIEMRKQQDWCPIDLGRDFFDEHEYEDQRAQAAWIAWQARAAIAQGVKG